MISSMETNSLAMFSYFATEFESAGVTLNTSLFIFTKLGVS